MSKFEISPKLSLMEDLDRGYKKKRNVSIYFDVFNDDI